jgi:two-component system, NtrC family, nitrogen regulation response regulator NtrX
MALPATQLPTKARNLDPASADATGTLAQRVQAFERATVLTELERHGCHITQTAKALGLERSHLYKKCQQLGIDLQNLPRGE